MNFPSLIDWSDFTKLDIRAGTILSAEEFPKAKKPAYKLRIDFGPLGIKQSSAQITAQYTLHDLVGKQVVAVLNFPVKNIAGFNSECLVLGVYTNDNEVILLRPDKEVKNGEQVG